MRLLPLAALAALWALSYAGALGGAFVFDDLPSIRDNPLIRDLGAWWPGSAGWRAGPNRWLTYATFALNVRLGGLDPFGFKVVNVGLHLANALLVYALVRVTLRAPRLGGSALSRSPRGLALVAAALFVSHPLQTQAVTYVVQRAVTLATFFYLLAAVAYARWRLWDGRSRWRRAGWYALALAALLLGMRSKEIVFTAPLALALWEVCFGTGPRTRRALALVPLLATMAVIPGTWLDLGRPLGQVAADAVTVSNQTDLSRWDYLVTQPAVVARYLGLLLLPIGQSVDHLQALHRSVLEPAVLAGLAIVAGMVALALWSLLRPAARFDPGGRLVAFGIGWFFLALSVESSLIPLGDLMFEHRVYLPSAGVFAAATAGTALILANAAPRRWPRILPVGGLALAVALAQVSAARNRVWANEVTLWSDAARKAPAKARPHLNLGHALLDRGDLDGAIAASTDALRADAASTKALHNLGIAYVQKGELERAISYLKLAVALAPDDPEPHNTLGIAYAREGRQDLASTEIGAALRLRAARGR